VPEIANYSASESDISSNSYLSPRAANRGFHMYKEMSGKESHMKKAVSVGIREQGAWVRNKGPETSAVADVRFGAE
jgi:hypothetical protein